MSPKPTLLKDSKYSWRHCSIDPLMENVDGGTRAMHNMIRSDDDDDDDDGGGGDGGGGGDEVIDNGPDGDAHLCFRNPPIDLCLNNASLLGRWRRLWASMISETSRSGGYRVVLCRVLELLE